MALFGKNPGRVYRNTPGENNQATFNSRQAQKRQDRKREQSKMDAWTRGSSKEPKGTPTKLKKKKKSMGNTPTTTYGMKTAKEKYAGRRPSDTMDIERHVPGKGKGKTDWSLKNPAIAAGVGAIAGAGLTALFSKRRNKTTTYNITNSRYPYVPRY